MVTYAKKTAHPKEDAKEVLVQKLKDIMLLETHASYLHVPLQEFANQLVAMSKLVSDQRIKNVLLNPFSSDGEADWVGELRSSIVTVIRTSKDDLDGINAVEIYKLHRLLTHLVHQKRGGDEVYISNPVASDLHKLNEYIEFQFKHKLEQARQEIND